MASKTRRRKVDAFAGAQVVARVAQLLSLVAQRSGSGTGHLGAALAQKSGLSRPTVHRLLHALQATGLLEQDEVTRRWHLGPEAHVLGALAGARFSIERLARSALIRIADETAESAFLSIRRGAESVCLIREEGAYPIRTHVLQAGDRLPLGVGSAGIAMLACLEDSEIATLLGVSRPHLQQRFPRFTARQIKESIAETRATGYAVNRGLLLPGSWGIAAAVVNEAGSPIAAVSITAIEARLPPERLRELGKLLIAESQALQSVIQNSRVPVNR
jgi:DNA-binding IclR family transcriptional regulator